MDIDINKPITISFPNQDTAFGDHVICPKEVAQKAYVAKKGEYIDFCGKQRKVKDVRITDEFIFIDID